MVSGASAQEWKKILSQNEDREERVMCILSAQVTKPISILGPTFIKFTYVFVFPEPQQH